MIDINECMRVPIEDLRSFEGRCKRLYKIQEKSGETNNFVFLQSQKILNEIVEEEFIRTKNELGASQCRIIICKPRQIGATTYSNIKSLDMQINDEGSNGAIIAHDQDTTEKVYLIYKRAYDNLPTYVIPTHDDKDLTKREYVTYLLKERDEWNKDIDLSSDEYDQVQVIKIKPDPKTYSGKRIGFDQGDSDSMTSIFTAGKGDTGGLGGTIRRVHLTESASYSKYKGLLQALNPSVPKFADNVFYINESTANGTTGDGEGYYKAWTNAVKGWESYQQGKAQTYSGFRPVFVPWYMIDEYELPLSGGKFESIEQVDFGSPEDKRTFLENEKVYMEEGIYNPLTKEKQIITPEKINWYRFIIKTDCEFDYKSAQRFYPTTPEEAFVASSHCFFHSAKLSDRKTYLLNNNVEHEKGDLVWDETEEELVFKSSGVGSLTIYSHPEKDWENRYVIGIDIARNREDGDYSVAVVKDRLDQSFVAMYYGRVDQDIFANIVMEMGLYYNEALLVPESNLDTVTEIIKPDGLIPYIGDIYYQESGKNMNYGYWTSGSTRQIMLDSYKAFLRDNPSGYDVLQDIQTVDEHISFVRKQTRTGVKYEADEGSHDDIVIACALSNIGDEWWDVAPEKYKPKKIFEFVTRKSSRKKKFIRNSKLGRSHNIT